MSEWKCKEGRDDDSEVPFGRKAKHWLARKIRFWLNANGGGYPFDMQFEELDPTVEWLMTDPMRYVEWEDLDTFTGPRYAFGHWKFKEEQVKEDLNDGFENFRRTRASELDAQNIQSLDDWLKADIAGTLANIGALGGSNDLDRQLQVKLRRSARTRQGKWPRKCADCGDSYLPKRSNGKLCDGCKEARAVKAVTRQRRQRRRAR